MKITIATGLYPPEIGGPATYAAMLESVLPNKGIEVITVPFGSVRHYPKIIRHVVYGWKLWVASRRSDIIYALDPISVGLPALIVSKLSRKKFLLRVPGDYAWEQGQLRFGVKDNFHNFIEQRYSYGSKVSALCWLESFVAKNAKLVVVPSEYMKTAVSKWGVDEGHIKVVYSALQPLDVSSSREELRVEFSYSYPTIVSAGRLIPNKGFLSLIKVFAQIKEIYKDAQLVIVGDGPQQEELIDYVGELRIVDSVRFTGSLSKDALGAVIKAGDVFVLNTAHEGLSHQLLEVMDIGTPIVTTRVGGNTELITDKVQGYLVEFDNVNEIKEAVIRVLNHPGSHERITQSARARSKQFATDKVVNDLIQIINEIHGK